MENREYPKKGMAVMIVKDGKVFLGKLKSAHGAGDIESLRRKAYSIKITSAKEAEFHPHDILITKEPPNCQVGN